MSSFIIIGFFSAFIIAILNEAMRLRWWKAPIAIVLSTAGSFLLGHEKIGVRIVTIGASSFLSLLLLLIAEKLATPTIPLPPLDRRR
jgi:hypothetical protein